MEMGQVGLGAFRLSGTKTRVAICRRRMRAAFSLSFFLVCFFACAVARADKVAVLPFRSTSGATSTQLDSVVDATRQAAQKLGHKLPTDSEMLTAKMAVEDGVAD